MMDKHTAETLLEATNLIGKHRIGPTMVDAVLFILEDYGWHTEYDHEEECWVFV